MGTTWQTQLNGQYSVYSVYCCQYCGNLLHQLKAMSLAVEVMLCISAAARVTVATATDVERADWRACRGSEHDRL